VDAKDRDASPGRGAFDLIGFAGAAAVGALLSLALTGFVFGINNNIFHLPIVGALYDEPQFAQDPYIQSLRFFASGLWLLLRGVDRYVDTYGLFLGLDYLSRFLAFVGFLACADVLGVRRRKERALFSGLLCLTPLLRGFSYAGEGGLFLNYFTHSEIANGLTLISLYFAYRGRLTAAFGFNGAVFFVNAFIAVWNALPLGMIVLYLLFVQQVHWRKAAIDGAIGLLVFFMLSAPVIWNVLSNPDFGSRTDFDIVAYHKQYFPYHFLFAFVPLKKRIAVAIVCLLAFSSFAALGAPARPFLLALFGYMAVYVLGIIAPHITRDATILNMLLRLTLLRVSTFFHLLAALGSLALAIQWLMRRDRIHAKVLAPLLVVLLCTSKYLLVAAPFVILVSLIPGALLLVPPQLTYGRLPIGYAAAVCIAIAGASSVLMTIEQNRESAKVASEWTALGRWARANTPADAIFLIPTVDISKRIEPRSKGVSEVDPAIFDSAIFEYEAHRRVWIDDKRGGAVMWAPSYYKIWWPRVSDVLALGSHYERMAYARQKAINYVVDFCAPDQGPPPLFRTERLCVYFATKI
jgi:hypothetical protein